MSDIRDSIQFAMETISDREDGDVNTPAPISTENEPLPEKVPEDETPGQKSARERRESVKNAMTKHERLQADRSKREKSDEAKTSPVRHEDEKIRRGIIEKAMKSMDNVATTKETNDPELRKVIQSLRQRRPHANLGELVRMAEEWGPAFAKDPHAARDMLMRSYLGATPEMFGKVKDVKYEPGLRGSLQRAQEMQRDQEELTDFIKKHGKDYPRILQQLADFDSNMSDDPVGTSARIAAAHGALDQPAQRHTLQPAPHPYTPQQESLGRAVQQDIDALISAGEHPGMEDPGFQDVVADVLMDMRHLDWPIEQKFSTAYQHVRKHLDEHNERQKKAKTDKKSDADNKERVRKGSKSISGGKSHSPEPGPTNGIRASLAKAKGLMA